MGSNISLLKREQSISSNFILEIIITGKTISGLLLKAKILQYNKNAIIKHYLYLIKDKDED